MRYRKLLMGMLLSAGMLPSQTATSREPQVRDGEVDWFTLNEARADVSRILGQPTIVAEFGDFRAWQYQMDTADRGDFSYQVVFRKSTGRLVSVTRNYDPERDVAELLPDVASETYRYTRVQPAYSVRLRRLSGGRILMAMGASKASDAVGQLVLMRESEVRYFYPWLLRKLESGHVR